MILKIALLHKSPRTARKNIHRLRGLHRFQTDDPPGQLNDPRNTRSHTKRCLLRVISCFSWMVLFAHHPQIASRRAGPSLNPNSCSLQPAYVPSQVYQSHLPAYPGAVGEFWESVVRIRSCVASTPEPDRKSLRSLLSVQPHGLSHARIPELCGS